MDFGLQLHLIKLALCSFTCLLPNDLCFFLQDPILDFHIELLQSHNTKDLK